MTVGQQGPGSDGRVSDQDNTEATRVRASSQSGRSAAPDDTDRAIVTAELPALAPRRSNTSSPRANPAAEPTPKRRRDPAPSAVRIVVWFLFFVFLFALAGDVTVQLHPDWLSFLRNDEHLAHRSTPPTVTVPPKQQTSIGLISSSPTIVAYSVPASSYSLVIETKKIGEGSWTEIRSPLTAKGYLFASTIPPGTSKTVTFAGSGSVRFFATITSLTVVSGSKTLGTLKTPKLNVTYEFTSTAG